MSGRNSIRRARKVRTRQRPTYQLLEPKRLLSVSQPVKVADYRDDFGTSSPLSEYGWSYQWNAPAGWSPSSTGNLNSGNIDNPETRFRKLVATPSEKFTPDGNFALDSRPAGAISLSKIGGHTGLPKTLQPGINYNGQDRFSIATFAVDTGGVYELTDSFLQLSDVRSTGMEVRVCVNRQKSLLNQSIGSRERIGFDTRLGYLRRGDQIHVVFGAGQDHAYDSFLTDFSIVRHTNRTAKVASFSEDLRNFNSKSDWQYLWNAPQGWNAGTAQGNPRSSLIGITSNYQPLVPFGKQQWRPSVSTQLQSPTWSMRLDELGGVPGAAYPATSVFKDRYVIARYTIPTGGNYVVSNSFLKVTNPLSDGVEVVVHRENGDRLHGASIVATAGRERSFDLLLGDLSAGEHLYFAFGGIDNATFDRFETDFSIERVFPRELPLRFLPTDRVVEVADFGASPNDGKNDWYAINRAIALASADDRNVEIRLGPGTWDIYPSKELQNEDYFFEILREQNLTFNGQGAELLIHDHQRGVFQFLDSKNVIVRNLKIDYAAKTSFGHKPTTFTQGVITNVDVNSKTITVAVDLDRFLAPDKTFTESSSQAWGYAIDPNTAGRLKFDSRLNYPTRSIKHEGGNRFQIQTGFVDGLATGDRYVLQRRYGNAVFSIASYSQQISIIGVRAYSSPSVFISSNSSQATNVIRSSMTIRPGSGRWKSGNADGIHAQSNRVGPWIESSQFKGLSDDVMNFYTLPMTILQRNTLRTLTLAAIVEDQLGNLGSRSFHIGDLFTFTDPIQGTVIQKAKVVQVNDISADAIVNGESSAVAAIRVTFDQDIHGVSVGRFPRGDNFGFRDDTTVFNTSVSRDFLVERNLISNSRRFGNYVMADNGELNHNTYVGLSDQAILGRNETAWPLGLFPSNISIRSNRFFANGLSSRYLHQDQVFGTVDFHMNRLPELSVNRDVREIRNLRIVDNEFHWWRKFAVSVRNADSVTILDNRFFTRVGDSGGKVSVKYSTFF